MAFSQVALWCNELDNSGKISDPSRMDVCRHRPNCPDVFHKEGHRLADFKRAWDRALTQSGYKPTFKCRDCGEMTQLELSLKWRKEGPTVLASEGKVKKGEKRKCEETVCARCKGNRFKRNSRVFHDNRRTAVRNLVRTGTPNGVAMRISGTRPGPSSSATT